MCILCVLSLSVDRSQLLLASRVGTDIIRAVNQTKIRPRIPAISQCRYRSSIGTYFVLFLHEPGNSNDEVFYCFVHFGSQLLQPQCWSISSWGESNPVWVDSAFWLAGTCSRLALWRNRMLPGQPKHWTSALLTHIYCLATLLASWRGLHWSILQPGQCIQGMAVSSSRIFVVSAEATGWS